MMRSLVLASLVLVACKTTEHARHSFDDADAWAAQFEDPSREQWQKPAEVIATFALPPDAKVADLGSATGYFAVRIAKVVPQGQVYGVDVESSMVDYLTRRAEREQLGNLTSLLAAYDDAKIPEPVDLILIVNTYHHIEARPAYFTRLARSLKPGGRLAIIDFTPASKKGPPVEGKVPPAQVEVELEQAGYALAVSHAFLPEQFFLVFTHP